MLLLLYHKDIFRQLVVMVLFPFFRNFLLVG